MFTVGLLFIATTVAVDIAVSKLEATEGDNVTIPFNTGVERVDEVRIIFQGESKGKRLLAQFCSPESFPICDPVETSHLQVEGGNVSMILLNVNISRSGLYTAQVITANKVYEVTATLVVNQAPVSSSPASPHSSSRPKPPSSSKLIWIVIVIVIPLVIIVSVGVCFWKLRKKSKTTADGGGEEEEEETPTVSRSSVTTKNKIWKNNCGGCVAVPMNGCGENAESFLPS
ncbi:hypothetical protein R3I94_017577 [Phoxinus phoxinus]